MKLVAEQPAQDTARKQVAVCVLDENPGQLRAATDRLERAGYRASGATMPEDALEKIRLGRSRVVFVTSDVPGMDALTFLAKALQIDPDVRVILTANRYSADSAIEAITHGAYDYFGRPVDHARLEKSLDTLTEAALQRAEIRELDEQLSRHFNFQGIVGKSAALLEVLDLVRRLAPHYATVLISGPAGAGKELVAHALHTLSPAARERFAVCHCSGPISTLVESQLFGHMRGSFSGATDARPGLFEYADGGTVFLDEIASLSAVTQGKLLRAIESREVQRLGSAETRKVNVRLIAATNRDLRAEILAGRFREDLFLRLGAIEIKVPSLNERPEDIPILVQHFLKKYGRAYGKRLLGLSRRTQVALQRYDWPGNVRELENAISTAAPAASADFVDLGDLPAYLRRTARRSTLSGADWQPLPLDEVRRMHIERVLELCKGNRVRASQVLGIGRTSLYRFLKRTHVVSIPRSI